MLRSFLGSVSREPTDFHRAAIQQARAAFGEFGGRGDGLRLDDRKSADDFLRFDERTVRDNFRFDNPAFVGQPITA